MALLIIFFLQHKEGLRFIDHDSLYRDLGDWIMLDEKYKHFEFDEKIIKIFINIKLLLGYTEKRNEHETPIKSQRSDNLELKIVRKK
jgi:hypothetical protein